MPTNLAIDDIQIAAALSEYIAHRKRLEILDLFGTVDFDPAYDYKAERRKKR